MNTSDLLEQVSTLLVKREPLSAYDLSFLKSVPGKFNTTLEFLAFFNQTQTRASKYESDNWAAVDTLLNAFEKWDEVAELMKPTSEKRKTISLDLSFNSSNVLRIFEQRSETKNWLFHCPQLQNNPSFVQFVLSNPRTRYGWVGAPLNEEMVEGFIEREKLQTHHRYHSSQYSLFYNRDMYTYQASLDEPGLRAHLQKQMRIWNHIHTEVLPHIPLNSSFNECLSHALENGFLEEAKRWVNLGATLNPQVNDLYYTLLVRHLPNEPLSPAQKISFRMELIALARKVGLPPLDTSFFKYEHYMLESPVLAKMMMQPEFASVVMTPEGVKFWAVQHAQGWKKNVVGVSGSALEWALKHGLSVADFHAGLRHIFLNIENQGHQFDFLKGKKLDKVIELAAKTGFQFQETEIPHFRLTVFALYQGASEESFTHLRTMKAHFVSSQRTNLLEVYFSQKRTPHLSLLSKLVEETTLRHGVWGREKLLFQTLEHQSTLLHVAAKALNGDAVRYLASQGLQINAKDDKGNTPFHWAAKRYASGTEGMMKRTIEAFQALGFDWTQTNEQGKTGMMVLARNGSVENILKLMALDPSLFSMSDKKGHTMMDAMQGRSQTTISNVEREGLNLNLRSETTDTPAPSRKSRL